MNERIKQLMLQAFQEQYGDAVTPGAREAALTLVSGWGSKFAELLIKKCANLCYNQALIESEKSSLERLHKERALDAIGLKITEHFGVE